MLSLHIPSTTVTAQARFFFQWADWLEFMCRARRLTPCWLNMDETSIARSYDDASGFVVVKRRRPADRDIRVRTSLSQKRGAVTYLALISSNAAVRLPQLVVGNYSMILQRDVRRLRPEMTRQTLLWRQRSSWNNAGIMLRWLHEVRDSLPVDPNLQPILCMDVACFHYSREVVDCAYRLGFWLLYVPSLATHLLQPCDVRMFNTFKHRLSISYHELKLAAAGGRVAQYDWLRLVCRAIQWVGSANWPGAFDAAGLNSHRLGLSDALASLNGYTAWNAGRVPMPGRDEFNACYPARMQDLFHRLLRGVIPVLD